MDGRRSFFAWVRGPLVASDPMHPAAVHDGGAPSAGSAAPVETQADLNQERLWTLLGRGAVTLEELHEHGVKFPAQEMYDLQLAGHAIDRLRVIDGTGQPATRYRLRTG